MSLDKLHNQVEHMIAVDVVDALLKVGYRVVVDNGEDATMSMADRDQILAAMSLTDEETLVCFLPKSRKRVVGWVKLIYGNGVDLVSDYTENFEDIIKPIYERWGDDGKPIPPALINAWLMHQKVVAFLKMEPGADWTAVEARLEDIKEAVEALGTLAFQKMPGGHQAEIETALRLVGGKLNC